MAYYTTTVPPVAPPGWAICDGSGTPDLRGRFILGAGQGNGVDSNGDAFVNRAVGNTGGAALHTLTTSQMPNHSHTVYSEWDLGFGSYFNQGTNKIGCSSGTETATSTGPTGDGAKHNNMPPFYVLVYIMKTDDYGF